MYIGWLAGQRSLGSIPAFPAPDPASLIRVGQERPTDRRHASFRLMGRRLGRIAKLGASLGCDSSADCDADSPDDFTGHAGA